MLPLADTTYQCHADSGEILTCCEGDDFELVLDCLLPSCLLSYVDD